MFFISSWELYYKVNVCSINLIFMFAFYCLEVYRLCKLFPSLRNNCILGTVYNCLYLISVSQEPLLRADVVRLLPKPGRERCLLECAEPQPRPPGGVPGRHTLSNIGLYTARLYSIEYNLSGIKCFLCIIRWESDLYNP